jgi:predicted NUDIX family phosphoesterase
LEEEVNKDYELVLGVETKYCAGFNGFEFDGNYEFSGISKDVRWLYYCLNHAMIMPRGIVEDNPQFIQFIPYIVVKGDDKILSYQRSGAETRLSGKLSVGFGGHVNKCDVSYSGSSISPDTFYYTAAREVSEELDLSCMSKFEIDHQLRYSLHAPLAIFKSEPCSMVNKVHLGLFYIMNISSEKIGQVALKDEGSNLSLQTKEDLLKCDLEDWSRFVVNQCL